MAYYDGQGLDVRLSHGSLAVNDALAILRQTALGLRKAHHNNIIHRDIKPSNIMLTTDGEVKIVDFGIAKIIGVDLTRSGKQIGTLAYMSPEMLAGEAVDRRTDIWSLGVVLHEMLTGKRPMVGQNDYPLLATMQCAEALKDGLTTMVKRSLCANPSQRYGEMSVLLNDLDALPHGGIRPFTGYLQTHAAQASHPTAERRQLTLLHCRCDFYAPPDGDWDPELMLSWYHDLRATCQDSLTAFDGQLLTASADSLLACFGFPTAHEDDTNRAMHVAVAWRTAIQNLINKQAQTGHTAITTRIAVHTGTMVVTTGDTSAEAILGQSRMDELLAAAAAGQIVVNQACYRLIRSRYTCRRIDNDDHTPVYKVTAQPQEHYYHSNQAMLGRQQEMQRFSEFWTNIRSRRGTGQCLFVSGEAGIGKSRLIQAFQDNLDLASEHVIEFFCSPYHRNSVLYPCVHFLNRQLDKLAATQNLDREQKLRRFVTACGLPVDDAYPWLGALLGFDDARRATAAFAPQQQKQQTMQTLLALIMKRTERDALLLIVEDLHWADATSLELFALLMEQLSTHPILAVFSHRLDFTLPWPMRSMMHLMNLMPLTRRQSRELIEQLLQDNAIPEPLLKHITDKTDGVPLFVEELTKTVLEAGVSSCYTTGSGITTHLPNTLIQSLNARLDHLGRHKAVAQLGAMLGRDFSFALLRAVYQDDEEQLKNSLAHLVNAELLLQNGLFPDTKFVFKHALIQDAAYESLLKSARRNLHNRIAEVIEQQFPELTATDPAFVAHQFYQAGNGQQAVAYWQIAGQQALHRSSYQDAMAHFGSALQCLSEHTNIADADHKELLLRSGLGTATIAVKGFAAPQVGEQYQRVFQISRHTPDKASHFPAVWGLWVFYLVRGELQTAHELASEMLATGQALHDDAMTLEGHWTLGDTLFWRGKLTEARDHLEQAIALYQPQKHHQHAFLYGQDPYVVSHCYLAYTEWFLGSNEGAVLHAHHARQRAAQLKHPFSISWSLGFTAVIKQWQHDVDGAMKTAGDTVAYCREQGHPFWLSAGLQVLGWAMVEKGRHRAGIDTMLEGLGMYRQTGSEVVQTYFLGLLAQAYISVKRFDDADQTIKQAFAKAQDHGEQISEIDLYRIRGSWYLHNDDVSAAEAAFKTGMAMARRLHARAREQQAAQALCGLWRQQGRMDEADSLMTNLARHCPV